MEPIGKYVAWQLCAEIWKENRHKWYSLDAWRCWNCWRLSKASPADRLVSEQADYRGCAQVNRRYHERYVQGIGAPQGTALYRAGEEEQ